MKSILCLLFVFVLSEAWAQLNPVTSGLFNWKPTRGPHEMTLKGSTTFFGTFEVITETLKASEKKPGSNSVGFEELIIVKEGELTVGLGGSTKSIGPGSIAFVMPGENYSCENKSAGTVVYYHLRFKAKAGTDINRGKSNGGSFIIDWNDLQFNPSDVGGRRDYFNKPTAMCTKYEMHVTTLNEGLPSHAPHKHAEEEIILLMKGNATMNVEKKDYPMVPGDFVFAASNDFHGIRNSGAGQCEYFAFQWK